MTVKTDNNRAIMSISSSPKWLNKLIIVALLTTLAVYLSGCLVKQDFLPSKNKVSLKKVRFWAYQIQGQDEDNNIKKLASSHYDLLVIDQTRSIKGEETYNSQKDIALLKKSSNSYGEKKIVVCYLDIGEAESYRWYWRKNWRIGKPAWILAKDPDGWDENYPVRFWDDEWKKIIKQYLDRIIADGYDGVYLDWLEVYSFKPVAEAAKAEGLNSRQELIRFISQLSRYARSKRPGFIVIAQNAAELGRFPQYVRLFDAIAQEAIWYDGAGDPDLKEKVGDVPVDSENSKEYIDNLKRWQQLGKPVFNVEYAQSSSKVKRAYQMGKRYKFKTYVSLRLLDELTKTPPPGY